MAKDKELSEAEKRDAQRAQDRQDELDRQAKVNAAMEQFYKDSREEAEKRLRGITTVDNAET